jgi:hypothetical protein
MRKSEIKQTINQNAVFTRTTEKQKQIGSVIRTTTTTTTTITTHTRIKRLE